MLTHVSRIYGISQPEGLLHFSYLEKKIFLRERGKGEKLAEYQKYSHEKSDSKYNMKYLTLKLLSEPRDPSVRSEKAIIIGILKCWRRSQDSFNNVLTEDNINKENVSASSSQ